MLPERAFQPRDRYGMTREGGGGGIVGDIVGGIGDVFQGVADVVSDIGRGIDDFVTETIPGGWVTVAAVGTGMYLGGAETAAAAGAAETAGAATAAEAAAAGGTAGGVLGGTGLLAGSTGAGFTATGAGAPGLASMGGGTGLLAPVPGGVVGATGFTAANALPVLGSPGSFINNPAVLGQPVITPEVPSTLSVSDALRGARLASNLMGGTQPTTQPQAQELGQMQATGVDLFTLPQLTARTPGIANLLSPANANVLPTFDLITGQSLLPSQRLSLLG